MVGSLGSMFCKLSFCFSGFRDRFSDTTPCLLKDRFSILSVDEMDTN